MPHAFVVHAADKNNNNIDCHIKFEGLSTEWIQSQQRKMQETHTRNTGKTKETDEKFRASQERIGKDENTTK